MRRRPLLELGALAVATLRPLRAHSRRRIGTLHDVPREDPAVEAMFTRLAELGWSEIRNLSVEYRVIATDLASLGAQVESLVKLERELIQFSHAPVAVAVKAQAPSTPMVFNSGGDPATLGLVASLARPGATLPA